MFTQTMSATLRQAVTMSAMAVAAAVVPASAALAHCDTMDGPVVTAARDLADRYFFETVVRLHRQGEGEPYTGLKPAGTDHGEAIPAADRALESGSVADLERLLASTVRNGLHERFERALAARTASPDDVAAGRAYVAAYVALLHYVEAVEVRNR